MQLFELEVHQENLAAAAFSQSRWDIERVQHEHCFCNYVSYPKTTKEKRAWSLYGKVHKSK